MKIYIDVVFMINFFFDFLLLLTVNILLKRKSKLWRIFLGTLLGAFSLFSLFIPFNSLTLFIFKISISTFMILITFGRKYFVKNMSYLYFSSILLGGFLTFLNSSFSYRNEGLIFINNGFSINIIVLMILGPIILYFYLKQASFFEKIRPHLYQVTFYLKRKSYNYTGYLDTGNQLYDPYSKKPILLLYDPNFPVPKKVLYVPYETLNGRGLIQCFKVDKLILSNQEYENVLIGLAKKPFHLHDTEMILHQDYIS